MQTDQLEQLAVELRISILDMLVEAQSGHPGGSLSAIDALTALWFGEMRGVEPDRLAEDRDRFVLSKGHAVPALYAILAKKGFIPAEELKTLRRTGSRLQGHPDRVRLPIVEASTGSLGQGLSVAQGLALGLRMQGKASRVFCMIGDGESEEGQIWEAALSASKFKLSNLCVLLDSNNGQIDGYVSDVMPLEPIADKWRAFGWHVIDIDGHDMGKLTGAYREFSDLHAKGAGKPVFIIARTTKGKGIAMMENKIEWHGAVPKPDVARACREELASLKARTGKGAKNV